MNESIPNKEEIIEAVRTMWACPVVDRTDETEEILDKAYNSIAALAGKEAANQINSIWGDRRDQPRSKCSGAAVV